MANKGIQKIYKVSQERTNYSLHRVGFLFRWCEAERAQSQGSPISAEREFLTLCLQSSQKQCRPGQGKATTLVPEEPDG